MLKALTWSILMSLVLYVLLQDAGIAKTFNEKIKPPAQETAIPTLRYKFIVVETYIVSLLKDPKGKGIKIYRGAVKKSALDRMEWIGKMDLDFSDKVTNLMVEKVIKAMAIKYGANVAIIDFHNTKSTVVDLTDGGR